jgi:hypothetical protein
MDILPEGFDLLLFGDDVALEIQADINRFSVTHRGAAPDTFVVLFQTTNIGVALRLEARLGLSFGEAVRSGDRRPGIISALAVDGFVVWPVIGGRILCQRATRHKDEGDRRNGCYAHCHFHRYPPEATMPNAQAGSAHPYANG